MRFKSPVAPAKPMVVDAVLGAIVSVFVPEILAPTLIASVVIESALAPIEMVPAAPLTNEPAVTEVVPSTFTPPTAPLMVVVAEPELIVRVGVVANECALTVEPKVMAAFVVEIVVFCLINKALL